MRCPKCGSENVNVQMVTETNLVQKRRGILWWCFIGIWWVPIKWICFTWLALLVKLFSPKKYKTTIRHKSMCVCQNCGHHWTA